MDRFLNRVIHGDCSKIMNAMPNECVDLTVTSPPYDNLRAYNGYSLPFEEIAKQLFRITKEGGIVVWVVGDKTVNGSETGTSFKQALFFKEVGFNLHDTMIYKKKNPVPQFKTKRYTNTFEYMFVFAKGKPRTCNYLMEKTVRPGSKDYRGYESEFSKQSADKPRNEYTTIKNEKIRTNIWEYGVGGSKIDHPAIFPEKLAEDHILSWSNENEVIFDPMCGSGTTLKMAKLNNRKFIGIDYSGEYVELSNERLRLVTQ